MRLKSLKLSGFKSFANSTIFTFKHDITAIVGPNGCGKSNVIDAIRWVLGETSAKQLRGGAMSDVIFAGVEGRAGKSLASVELTFEHTQDEASGIRHALNLYHELTLRRQISKEGKSDYFINGQRVRRRDVVDVFLGTGLGSRSYAVIEQGMVGRIVESSPLELREFIEEAAGVSRYQARRLETQKQLSHSTENLERLYDVQSELNKQHKILSRQAQTAQKYQALHDELMKIHQEMLLGRMFDAWQLVEQKQTEQQQVFKQLAALEKDICHTKKELEVLGDKLAQTQWLKDDTRDKYHQACLTEQTAQHNVTQLSQRLEQCTLKITNLDNAKQQANDSIIQALDELDKINGELAGIAPKLQDLQAQKQQKQQCLTDIQSTHQKAYHQFEALTTQKQTLEHQQKSTERQIERLLVAQEKWKKKYAVLMAEQDSFAHHDDVTTCQQLKAHIEQLQERLVNLEQHQEQQEHFAKIQVQTQAIQADIINLEKRHAVLMGEYETLHKLLYKPSLPSSSDDMAQDDVLSTLREQIGLSDAGQKFADILDEFLGFWLDAKTANVLPYQYLCHRAKTIKTVLLTADLATVDVPHEQLLPLNTLLSPALAVFEQMYLWQIDQPSEYDYQIIQPAIDKGVVILTTTGWLIGQFGMVHLSKFGEKSDFLSQKIEHQQRLDELEMLLNALEQELDDKSQALKNANHQLETLKITIQERQAQINAINQELRQSEQSYSKLQAKISQYAIWQVNHAKSKALLEEERNELCQELQQQKQELTEHQQALDHCLSMLADAKLAVEAVDKLTKQHNDEMGVINERCQHLSIQQNTLSQAKIHAQKLLDIAQKAMTQALADGENLYKEQVQLEEILPQAKEILVQVKQQAVQLKIAHEEYEASTKTLGQTQQSKQDNLNTLQESLVAKQSHIAQLDAQISIAQNRLQDLGAEMSSIDKQFELSSMLLQFRQNPPSFVDNQARYQILQHELDKLGPVNMVAAVELAELEKRLVAMQRQISDITQSMDRLKDAIKTIDNKTKSLFLTTLMAVNTELNALFSKVFGGGQASLTLIDDENLSKADKWPAGLVLMAQPKGKKNSRLAVLSGGEKTLTALSLIFAIFKQHPAPFCVLDEVDAPLDDANVGRFTGLIGELASSVQFIFISHNKLAMQIAHELKGITMPTPGISSLVTVNLAEAERYLEPTA